jgi:hypothetical protein
MRQSAKDFERVLEFLQGEDLGQTSACRRSGSLPNVSV